jgi:hypothetical protein
MYSPKPFPKVSKFKILSFPVSFPEMHHPPTFCHSEAYSYYETYFPWKDPISK